MARKFYKVFLLFTLGLILESSSEPITYEGGCSYKNEDCRYEVTCDQKIFLSFYRTFDHHRPCPYVSYRGNTFDPIYLKIKDYKIEMEKFGSENLLLADMEGSANIVFSVDFSENDLSETPTLTSMQSLHILNLSTNVLTQAVLSNQYELGELEVIDLSHNAINVIRVNNHDHVYRNLKKINLAHNYMVSIQEGIFDSFQDLQVLDLSYNFIDALNILTFEGIKKLTSLNLKHNRLSSLGASLLRFNKLEDLNLSENKIVSITAVDFGKLSNLKNFDISNNLVQNIERNALNAMSLLTNLVLSHNVLEVLDKDILANLTDLQGIDLSKNLLRVLPKDMFKGKDISDFIIKENKLEGSLTKGMFEGLKSVNELDLSFQQLTAVEDFAFFGLESLSTLFLKHNRLNLLSKKAFNYLGHLEILDLSNNELTSIGFDKADLISLRSLLLQNNKLVQVTHEYFHGFNSLQFLDLSSNNISRLEINSFKSLHDLINIQISNNPVTGTLEESTFDGLITLPSLDISSTLLTTIKNGSFNGMFQLKELNISHSNISELQYNSMINTGLIETIDLSFNQLADFRVNTTHLRNLVNLILNNNLLKVVSEEYFKGLPRVLKIVISSNDIETIALKSFQDQKDLRHLDMAYNPHLHFNLSRLESASNLAELVLSGIQSHADFSGIKQMRLSNLEMSHSGISNITSLGLKSLKYLDNLVLSQNNISTVETGALNGIENLRKLDLSFNRITIIQPGAFKENTVLQSLNISHNFLKVVSYGIFRGLVYLETLDMSFNEISDLESERFYEVRSLSVLIVDHNKISSVNVEEFSGTSLSKLSIGDNPLPCEFLVNIKKNSPPFAITALKLDENSPDENVDGVTCNIGENERHSKTKHEDTILGNERILIDIKDILHNISLYKRAEKSTTPEVLVNDFKYLANMTKKIEVGNANTSSLLQNLSSTFEKGNANTNILLTKIFQVLTSLNTIRKPPVPELKGNMTIENLVPFINKVKQDLEDTIAFEKQNILNAVDTKIEQIAPPIHKDIITSPNKEAFKSSDKSDLKSFLFIEICVGSILVILILFIVYKFYNSGMFVPMRQSISTRQLSDNLDNSVL